MPVYEYFSPDTCSQYTFYRIPKQLFEDENLQHISNDAKILYGLLLDRVDLSVRNGWIDEHHHVYIIYTQQEIMDRLKVSNKTASRLTGELETSGLIEKRRQGLGRPDIIYVKNFISSREDSTRLKCRDYTTGRVDPSSAVMNKVHTINTNHNQTEYNEIDPVIHDGTNANYGDDLVIDPDCRFMVTMVAERNTHG